MKVKYLLITAVLYSSAFFSSAYANCIKNCRDVKVCFSANVPCQTVTISKTGITKLPHPIVYSGGQIDYITGLSFLTKEDLKKAYNYCQGFIIGFTTPVSTTNMPYLSSFDTVNKKYSINDCNTIDSEWNTSQWKSDEDRAEREKEQKLIQEQKDFIAKVAKEPYPPK